MWAQQRVARDPTPVRPRVWADIAESNQRLLLQQVDILQEPRALDAPYGKKQCPDARGRDRG